MIVEFQVNLGIVLHVFLLFKLIEVSLPLIIVIKAFKGRRIKKS